MKLNYLPTSKFLSVVCLFVLGSTTYGQSFELINTLSKNKRAFYFPGSGQFQVDRISSVQLNQQVRPDSWPNRIPFAACIDRTQNKAYYLQYFSLFKHRIKTIQHPDFGQLEDVTLSKSGSLFMVDSSRNQVFEYQLDKDLTARYHQKFPTGPYPFRCEWGQNKSLYILTRENKINIFRKSYRLTGIEKRINATISNYQVKDLTILNNTQIIVLAQNYIFKFNSRGRLLQTLPTSSSFDGVGHSWYNDIFCLDTARKQVKKFNRNLELLDTVELDETFKGSPIDLTLYQPYGYLGITGSQFGAYYGLKTDLEDIKITQSSDNFTVGFKVTFPSLISIKIVDVNQNKVVQIMKDERLLSKSHSIHWDGKDQDGIVCKEGPYTLHLQAEGVYSLANVIKKDLFFSIP